jgi:rRNA maturation endonuclease Nob1
LLVSFIGMIQATIVGNDVAAKSLQSSTAMLAVGFILSFFSKNNKKKIENKTATVCSICGYKLNVNDKFCSKCGGKIN